MEGFEAELVFRTPSQGMGPTDEFARDEGVGCDKADFATGDKAQEFAALEFFVPGRPGGGVFPVDFW